ncbi:MAG: YadA-like family protein, partial [Negativicoccus succinicivorans]|uniref:YadA-like family protein n=1 Tax=Negativicoccus succinicivorans TaxID=620903 RepID=UPI0026EEA873
TGAVLLGDKRKLTGADGSIVLGSADESAETNVKDATVIGHNANTTVASGVALGSDSVADRGKADAATVYLNAVDEVKATVKGDLAAVSVGNANATRQITGVAAGTEDTDAVNVAQLKAAAKNITDSFNDTTLQEGDNALSIKGDTLNLSVKDTKGNEVTGSVNLNDLKSAVSTTYTLEGEENDNNTTTIFLKGSDKNEQQVTVATKDTRNTIVDSDTVTVEAKAQEDGSNEYKLNVKTNGKVEKDNKGIVTGGTVYNETRIENDGKYIKAENTASQNLIALDKQVDANTTNITKLENNIYDMGGRIGELGNRVDRVGAGAAALAALHPLDFDRDDKWDFAAGYGNYSGAHAFAIGAYYRPNEDTMFSVGGSFGGGENMVNAGVSVKLGQGNNVSTSRVVMANEIQELKTANAKMQDENIEIKNENKEMRNEIEILKEQMRKLMAAK